MVEACTCFHSDLVEFKGRAYPLPLNNFFYSLRMDPDSDAKFPSTEPMQFTAYNRRCRVADYVPTFPPIRILLNSPFDHQLLLALDQLRCEVAIDIENQVSLGGGERVNHAVSRWRNRHVRRDGTVQSVQRRG